MTGCNGYYEGDHTNAFNTKEDLITEADKIFKQWFEPAGWKLEIIDHT